MMTSDSSLVFDPTSPSHNVMRQAAAPLGSLKGKVVGFIDNSKPNFEHLAVDLNALLVGRYGAARVVTHRKRSASMSAGAVVLDELAKECDLVITGSGD
jgi:hypothetical protein